MVETIRAKMFGVVMGKVVVETRGVRSTETVTVG
jgi:hypothetical protein